MDRLSELGTARGFAQMDVDRAKALLERAEEVFAERDREYQEYVAKCGQIDDGFGNTYLLCKPGCQLEIVRPGKVQCECETP